MSAVANVAVNLDSRGVPAKLKQIADRGKEVDRSLNGAAAATTKAGREIKTAANGMRYFVDATGRARKVNGQFVTSTEAAAAGIKKQDTAARSLIGTMTKLAATAGAGRVAAGITRTAAGFEEELRRAAAIEGGGNLDQLRQSIERVASTAAGTPTEVAALATSLSRAGFTAQETSESLQGIVTGAEATSVAFDQLGGIVSSSLRAFGLATSDTASVVDTLVQTANSSNQTILDLGEALSYAAPGARTLGISIGDLSATIGLLADNGIRGSRAGTSLSTGLNRLQLAASGSQEALFEITRGSAMLTKAMDTLGSQVLDAEGNLKPLDEVLLALKGSLDQLNVGQRVELTKALFGEEAGRGFQALLASSEEKIRSMFQTIENAQGKTEQVREEMRGFSDSMKVLGGNVENTTNAIGDKFIVVLKPLVDGLNATLKAASELPKPIRDIGAAAAAAGIAAGGLTLALKTLIPTVELLARLLGIGGLGGAMAALPWVAAAAGVAALTIGTVNYYQEQAKLNALLDDGAGSTEQLKNKQSELEQKLAKVRGELQGTGGEMAATGRKAARLRGEVAELQNQLNRIEGTYEVRLNLIRKGYTFDEKGNVATFEVAGVKYNAKTRAAINPPPTVSEQREAKRSGSGGGGGGGAAARGAAAGKNDEAKRIQERIKGLQQDVALNEKLRGIREKIAEADLAGDQALAVKLQGEERLLQLADSYDRLKAKATPAERDALEAKLQSEALLEQQNVLTQLSKLDSDKTKAFEDQLRPLEEQRRLLEAQLNGRREEEELIIQIENATRGLGDAEAQRVKQLIRGNAELEKQAKQPNLIRDLSAQVKQLQDELNPVKLATETITNGAFAIGDAFSQAFTDVISGAKSTEEALADTFESIGKAFLGMATEIIAKQLTMIALQTILKALGAISSGFSFAGGSAEAGLDAANQMGGVGPLDAGMFGFRANGGPVNANEPYIVGERGPELFMPSSSGMVMSNENLQAQNRAFLDSIDTENGGIASDDSEAEREATVATRAAMRESERIQENRMQIMSQQKEFDRRYERERIEQMASTPGKLDIKYESQVINNVEYVTREQAERMAAQSALRGRELAIGSLQNSVKTRKRVGI